MKVKINETSNSHIEMSASSQKEVEDENRENNSKAHHTREIIEDMDGENTAVMKSFLRERDAFLRNKRLGEITDEGTSEGYSAINEELPLSQLLKQNKMK
mmetsp:Transcript_9997/g.15136  ORF Transcript_9997/g.15136 Transcript_9997/m.15136 type:complete len:100 (-) Transcript_9997:3934-4233(-)